MNYKIRIASQTRWYRKWHKWIGVGAMFFFALIATTGILLAWKKNSNGYLLAQTQAGTNTQAQLWLSLDSIQKAAIYHLQANFPGLNDPIDRIDIRPEKGMAKVIFKGHYNAIQIDLTTGRLLQLEKRRADFIEQLHDGTILERISGIEGPKIVYSSLAGLSLLFLSLSGFWLWYNPKRIKKLRK